MASDAMKATAEKLVARCREGSEAAGFEEYYHADVVSVEAMAGPDGRETRGLDGLRGKHAWWGANYTYHGGSVEGPFPHGDDRFAVIFEMDVTEKASGERSQMREVAVYHTDPGGRIVREEFFYG
jgi:hypothetical protein